MCLHWPRQFCRVKFIIFARIKKPFYYDDQVVAKCFVSLSLSVHRKLSGTNGMNTRRCRRDVVRPLRSWPCLYNYITCGGGGGYPDIIASPEGFLEKRLRLARVIVNTKSYCVHTQTYCRVSQFGTNLAPICGKTLLREDALCKSFAVHEHADLFFSFCFL